MQKRERSKDATAADPSSNAAEVSKKHGVDPDAPADVQYRAFLEACRTGADELFDAFLTRGQPLTLEKHDPAIHSAVRGNHLERVRRLLELGADLEARNNKNESALWIAVSAGFDDLALALLELGASPDVVADNGWTALQRACKNSNLRLIQRLLKAGADPNLAPSKGHHPLRHVLASSASVNARLDALGLLLEAGADPDSITEPSLAFLCTVAVRKKPELEQLLARLLEAGMSDLPNRYGWTARMVAHWSGQEPIAAMLPPEDDASETVRKAVTTAEKGDESALVALLDDGLDVETTDPNGTSLLATCCARQHWTCAETLLARGADPLATGSNGYNPAALCYLKGRTDLMWSMFDVAGEVNDASGTCRVLVNAASAGDLETVRRLLERGANPNSADAQEQSCLLLAVAKKHATVASLLLEHRADPNTGAGTKTALHHAVEAEDSELAKALLDAGADPDGTVIAPSGMTALRDFVNRFKGSPKASLVDLAALLLDYGASVDDYQLQSLGIQAAEGESKADRLLEWFRARVGEKEAARKKESEAKAAREMETRLLELVDNIERLGGVLPTGWAKTGGARKKASKVFPTDILRALASVTWPNGLRVTTDDGALSGGSLEKATLHTLSEWPDAKGFMGEDRAYGLLLDEPGLQKLLLVALDDVSADPKVFVMDYDGDENPPSIRLTELFYALRPTEESEATDDAPPARRATEPADVIERRQIYLIERCDQIDGLSRVGGLPPALSADGWPEHDGHPMIHIATVDVRSLDLGFDPEAVAVSVFAHSVTELEAFEPGSRRTHVTWIREEALGQDARAPEGVEILEARGCRVVELCTIEIAADVVVARFSEGLDADDLERDVTGSPAEDAHELLGDLLEDEGQPSYLGGWAYNPSALGGEETEDAPEGPFVMRLRESLVGSDANFAGGGWLFVHRHDAWAEQ